MGLWTANSTRALLVDSQGRLIDCAECPCEGEVAAPCECPDGLADCYQLAGYTDGDLAACEDCDDYGSNAWDGQLDLDDTCIWRSGETVGEAESIDGKGGLDAVLTLVTTGTCRWALTIVCRGGFDTYTIWSGAKTVGLTPEGVYARTSGCDTTSALEIEACP